MPQRARLPWTVMAASLVAVAIALSHCAKLDPLARFACTDEGTCESADEMCVQDQCWSIGCADGGTCPPGYACSAEARCVSGSARDAGPSLRDAAVAPGDAAEPAPDADRPLSGDVGPAKYDAGGKADGGPERVDGSVVVDSCVINGLAYPAGTVAANDPCLECDPSTDQFGWSPRAAGSACAEGRQCMAGACLGPAYVASTAQPLRSEVYLDLVTATTAGNALVIGLEFWDYPVVPVVEVGDAQGDAFVPLGGVTHSGTVADHLEVWYAPAVSGGVTRIRVTFDRLTRGKVSAHAAEYSGLSTAADPVSAIGFGTGTSLAVGPLAAATDQSLVYGFFGCNSACKEGAGFTRRSATSGDSAIAEDQIVGPISNLYATAEQPAGGIWVGGAVIFPGGSSPSAAITYVQGTAAELVIPSFDRITLAGAGAKDDTLIAAVALRGDFPPVPVIGLVDLAAPWTPLLGVPNGTNLVQVWSRKASGAQPVTLEISVDDPGSGKAVAHLLRYSSLASPMPGQLTTNSGSGGTALNSGPLSGLTAPSLVFGFAYCDGPCLGGGSGFAVRENLNGSLSQDLLVGSPGVVRPTWTVNNPGQWIASGFAFSYLP